MASYNSDFIGVIERQVCIDEDKEVCYNLREGKGVGEQGPCIWIGIKNDRQKGGNRAI